MAAEGSAIAIDSKPVLMSRIGDRINAYYLSGQMRAANWPSVDDWPRTPCWMSLANNLTREIANTNYRNDCAAELGFTGATADAGLRSSGVYSARGLGFYIYKSQ